MTTIVTNNCPPQLLNRNAWRSNDLSMPVRVFQNDSHVLEHGADRISGCKLIVQTVCKGHVPAKLQGGLRDAAMDLAHADHANIVPVASVMDGTENTHVLFERPGGGCLSETFASSSEPLTERQVVATVLAGALQGVVELQKADLFMPCLMPAQVWMAAAGKAQVLVLLLPLLQPLAAADAAASPEELQYLAPELLRPLAQQDANKEHAAAAPSASGQHRLQMAPSAADKACAWSLGVLAQKLCAQTLPYKGSSVQQLVSVITAGRGKACAQPPLWMSDQGKAFINATLQPDPAKRPKVAELLQHPWITTLGFQPAGPQDRYTAGGQLLPQLTREEAADLLQAQGGALSSPQDAAKSLPGGRPSVMVLPPPPPLQQLPARSESPASHKGPLSKAPSALATNPTLRSPASKPGAAADSTAGAAAAKGFTPPKVAAARANPTASPAASTTASPTAKGPPATGRWAAPLRVNMTFHEMSTGYSRSNSSDLEGREESGRASPPPLVQPRSAVLAAERGKGGKLVAPGKPAAGRAAAGQPKAAPKR